MRDLPNIKYNKDNKLTTAEREAIANVIRTIWIGLQTLPGRPTLGGDPLQHAVD